MEATVIIPNLNGMRYLKDCLDSLQRQTRQDFRVILIDNGSGDGSADYVETHYPEVTLVRFPENTGFCRAVNAGIALADTPYVILLNNDTWCEPEFVAELVAAMTELPDAFSCASCMVQMKDETLLDDAGDYYCALGWAYAYGRNRKVSSCRKRRKIFSACAGAAIYRRTILEAIGGFDEAHFAYLEDVDVGYRARIEGYFNYYIPTAVVHHVGSAASGSVYNEFKIRHSSRNSIYLIYKNMPWPQIVLNLPFLIPGFFLKLLFFSAKGYGREYLLGLRNARRLCRPECKKRVEKKNRINYFKIQLELWINLFRRVL